MKKLVFQLLLIILIFSSCENKKSKTSILETGEFYLTVPGGNIWYKVTGTSPGVPVVLLHGGPGGSSFYLKVFEKLGNERQVIRYDQLGSGKSDMVTDTTFFTIDHFVQELESLRSHLGLEKWHVFGHSWGTILALEYFRNYPDKVSSLTFGSLCFNIPAWEQSTRKLLSSFPDSLKDGVLKAEVSGNFDDPLYQEAMNLFYAKYVWGPNPQQVEFDSLMATFNTELYGYMWGPSEFTATGTLKGYDATDVLSGIKIPVLFTVGEFDEIDPGFVKEMAGKVIDSRYVMFAGSSHMTPWDAPEESVKVLREFLNSVDSTDK